jgi:hypothetical protein
MSRRNFLRAAGSLAASAAIPTAPKVFETPPIASVLDVQKASGVLDSILSRPVGENNPILSKYFTNDALETGLSWGDRTYGRDNPINELKVWEMADPENSTAMSHITYDDQSLGPLGLNVRNMGPDTEARAAKIRESLAQDSKALIKAELEKEVGQPLTDEQFNEMYQQTVDKHRNLHKVMDSLDPYLESEFEYDDAEHLMHNIVKNLAKENGGKPPSALKIKTMLQNIDDPAEFLRLAYDIPKDQVDFILSHAPSFGEGAGELSIWDQINSTIMSIEEGDFYREADSKFLRDIWKKNSPDATVKKGPATSEFTKEFPKLSEPYKSLISSRKELEKMLKLTEKELSLSMDKKAIQDFLKNPMNEDNRLVTQFFRHSNNPLESLTRQYVDQIRNFEDVANAEYNISISDLGEVHKIIAPPNFGRPGSTPKAFTVPAPAEPTPMTRNEANQRIKELRQSMAGLEKDSPEFKAIQEQMKEINLQVKSAPQEPSVAAAPAPVKEIAPAREAPPRNISPLGLYSHGVESAHLLPMDKGTPQQIKKMLETKFSVKPTELEGFDEAFAGKDLVTREDVVKFFEDNRPQLEEVQYGGKSVGDPYEEMHNAAQRIGEDEDAFYRAVRGYDTPSFGEFRDAEQRTNWFLENRPEILDTFVRERLNAPARFGDRTEPGGENYRELLIKLKEPPKPPTEYVYKVTGAQPGTFATRQEANDYVTRLNRMRQTARDDPNMAGIAEDLARYPIRILTEQKPNPDNGREGFYYEAHYPGQRDVLAAPRLKDRYDTEGNKILNAEELQSDYSQVGRDEGFKPKKDVEEDKRLKENVVNTSKEWQQSKKKFNELYDQIQQEKIRQAYKDAPTPYDLPNALKEHEKWMKLADVDRVYQSYRQSFLTRGNSQLLPNLGEDFVNKLQDAHDNVVGAREAHDLAVRNRDDYVYSSNKGVDPAPYVTSTKDWVDLVLKRLLKEAVDGGYKKFVWTPAEQQFGRWGSEMVRWEKVPGEDNAWMVDAKEFIRPYAFRNLKKMDPYSDNVVSSKDELYKILDYAIGDHKKAAAMTDKAWERMQKEESGSVLPRKEGMEGFYGNKEHTSGVPPMVYARMKALLSKIDPNAKIAPHEIITHAEGDVGANLTYPDKLNTTMMPGVEITPKMIEAVRKGLPERARGGSIVSKALMLKSPSGSSLHEAIRIAKQHRGTPRRS